MVRKHYCPVVLFSFAFVCLFYRQGTKVEREDIKPTAEKRIECNSSRAQDTGAVLGHLFFHATNSFEPQNTCTTKFTKSLLSFCLLCESSCRASWKSTKLRPVSQGVSAQCLTFLK